MDLGLKIAGLRILLTFPDKYKGRFPADDYQSFLSSNDVSDLKLVIHTFESPTLPPNSAQLTPEKGLPILNYTAAGERYARLDRDELVLLHYNKLIIFNPNRREMEVFRFESLYLMQYFEAHLFNLLSCVLASQAGLIQHGSGFISSARAGIMSGPSGAGKTTAVTLLKPDLLLSDDVVAITEIDNRPIVHSTPIGGRTDGEQKSPLRAIFFLKHAQKFSITEIKPRAAILRYWQEQADNNQRLFRSYLPLIFQNAHQLFQKVPAYELAFSRDHIDKIEIEQLMGSTPSQ